MFNRITACMTLLFFFAVYVCGQDLFTFAGGGSMLGGEPTFDTALQWQVDYVLGLFKNNPDQTIIAHSQGGLRALGYAYQLKTAKAAGRATGNVKGIVALDSPVLGYSPLLQGKSVLLAKAVGGKTRVINGAAAAISFSCFPLFVEGEIVVNGIMLSDPVCSQMLTTQLNLDRVWITDLTPNSQFLKDNVLPAWIAEVRHWEEVWVWIPSDDYYLYDSGGYWGLQPVYVVDVPGHYDLTRTKFDSSLKVGFIVGQQNDPVRSLANQSFNPRGDIVSESERLIREGIGFLNTVLLAAGGIYTAGAAAFLAAAIVNFCCLNFVGGFAFLALAAYYGTLAYFCFDAYSITSNIPGWYGSVLGSAANDSFVLESDQSCSLAMLGTSPADPTGNIKWVPTANHQTSMYHPESWGDTWDNYTVYRLDTARVCDWNKLDKFLWSIGTVSRSGVFVQ